MRTSLLLISTLMLLFPLPVSAQIKSTPKQNVYLGIDASGLMIRNANTIGTLMSSLMKLKSASYTYHLDTLAKNIPDPSFTYYVNGVIYSSNNQIILTFDVKNQADSTIHLPLIFADEKNLYDKLNQASDQVLSTFPAFKNSDGKKKLNVIVVAKDIWGKSGSKAVTRDLLVKISEVSPGQNEAIQLASRNASMQYDYYEGNEKSLIEKTSVDAIFGVDVSLGDFPRVKSNLYITEGKWNIPLPAVYLPATDQEFLINLRKDFFHLLTHFVDSVSHHWRQDSIALFVRNLDSDVPQLTMLSHQCLKQKKYAMTLLMSYQALEKKKNATSYFQICSALKLQNRISEARFVGNIGLGDFPDDPSMSLLQGAILMELLEFKEAKLKIKASIAKDKNFYLGAVPNPFILLTRANLFLAEYDSAIYNASTYITVHPRDAEATYYLGKSYFYKGKYSQAISALKSVDTLRLANKNLVADVKTTLDRSYAALTRNKFVAGDVDSSRTVLRNSGAFGSNYELSVLYIKQVLRSGHFENIDSLITLGIKRKTFSENSIYYVLGLEAGNVAEEKGMSKEAILALQLKQIDLLSRHFKINPKDHRTERLIGSTYVRIGHTNEGIPFLKDALQKDSTLIGYRLDLAEAEFLTEDFKGTLQLLNDGQLKATSLLKNRAYYALTLYYRALARLFLDEPDVKELKELKKIFAKGTKLMGWEFETLEAWLNHQNMSPEKSATVNDLLRNMQNLFGKK